MESQTVNQLQFNLNHPASPTNLVTRVPANPQPMLIEKPGGIDPRRMELIGRLARRDLQRSRELQDAVLPPGPKNVERRLRQGRAAVSRKAAAIEQQQRQQLPSRSHSPPVRDTDRAWRPGPARLQPRENAASMKRHEAMELRRLRDEVQQYAVRMAELEAERLLGRGGGGGGAPTAGRRRPALPFPTRPRSPRVPPPFSQPALQPPPTQHQQQQQRLRPSRYPPGLSAPQRAAAPATASAANLAAPIAAPSGVSERERARIVTDVLTAIRRELGLRASPAAGLSASAATSLMNLSAVASGSLADLRNIDHRLSQLEREGDDIRDRWVAAFAGGDEKIYSSDGWRAEPPDPLRFVNSTNGGGGRLATEAAAGVIVGGGGGHRQSAALRLAPAEVAGIRAQRDRYRDFLSGASAPLQPGPGDGESAFAVFRPTQLTDAIAEQLLDEMLTDAAAEMLAASDAIVSQMVANETGGGGGGGVSGRAVSASPRVPSPRRFSPDAEYGDDYEDDYADEADEEAADAYANQEFESYQSSELGDEN